MSNDPPAADLGLWLSTSCGEADTNCEGALRATSIGMLCGWHAATLRPRASDRERELLQVIDAQAARLAAAQAALQWAVTTLDGYQADMPGTEHWMAGWAEWLEQQARPSLATPPGEEA